MLLSTPSCLTTRAVPASWALDTATHDPTEATMRGKRWWALLAALTVLLAACGGDSSGGTSAPDATEAPSDTTGDTADTTADTQAEDGEGPPSISVRRTPMAGTEL